MILYKNTSTYYVNFHVIVRYAMISKIRPFEFCF